MIKLSDRKQSEATERLQKAMLENSLDGVLLTETGTILSATGHYSNWQKYATKSGYCVAGASADGEIILAAPDYEIPFDAKYLPGIKLEKILTGIYVDELDRFTGQPAITDRPPTVGSCQAMEFCLNFLKSKKRGSRIGIQVTSLNIELMEYLNRHADGCTFVPCEDILSRANMMKTAWEIDALRSAAQASERAMEKTYRSLKCGASVGSVVNNYARFCLEEMGEACTGYQATVSVGKDYSPFIISPERYLEKGDIVRLDCGPHCFGYISDICRNYTVGPAGDREKKIYEILMKGFDRELEMIGPGVKCSDIFREVNDLVKRSGIEGYARGHVGHSIGTYCEEYPYISPSCEVILRPGMVMSIEVPYNNPYIGGLTPEDTLVITEDGCEVFTHVPHEIEESAI